MAENYYSYLDALEAPSAGRAIPASPAAPLDSNEEFFRQVAEQATKAQQTEAPPQEPGLGGRILTGVGDVLGAQKHGVDWAARHLAEAAGAEVNPEDTTGSMLRRAVGLEATPESGYLSRLAGSGLEFATDIATDPLTYETVVLGKLAGVGVKAGRVLAGLGEGAETVASLGRAAVPVADIQRAATLGKIAAPIATGAGAAFTGVLGAGAIQGGQQLAHTIQNEGFTPQAAEEALGTGLALGGGLAAGFHTGHTLFRKVNPVLKQGLESLVAKGELAPEEAAATIAREQGGGVIAPSPDPEAPPSRVAAEPQNAPPSPREAAPPPSEPQIPPQEAPIPAVEAPPGPVEALEVPARVEVAAPPPTEAPGGVETFQPVEQAPPQRWPQGRTVSLEVDGTRQEVDLSPEQAAAWDEAAAGYQRRVEGIKAGRLGGTLKAAGVEYAAQKRQITGALTGKEQANKAAFDAKIRKGDRVQSGGQEYEVLAPPAYGRVKVRDAAGTEINLPHGELEKLPASPIPNPTATVPVAPESIDAWAERIEPLKALGYDDADILAFSRESNGLAHTDDILKRGRKAGGGVFRTRLGGKAREGPPPTPEADLEKALRASLKPEEIQEAKRGSMSAEPISTHRDGLPVWSTKRAIAMEKLSPKGQALAKHLGLGEEQNPSKLWPITEVTDAEYAKADADPNYVPQEHVVGYIEAPLAYEGMVEDRVIQLGKMGAIHKLANYHEPGFKPTINVEAQEARPLALGPGRIEESRRAPLAPGALEGTEGLSEQIVGKGFTAEGGRSIREEYVEQEAKLGKAGAREWLEEQFLSTTERPPEEVLPKVQRASTRSILEQLEETLPSKSPKSIYAPGSPAARLLERYPHRADFIQEKVTRLLAQDSASAREVMQTPLESRPEAIYRWLSGTTKKAELDTFRKGGATRVVSLEEAGQQAAEQAGAALQGGGGHASLTDLPPELKQRLREFKRANDSYAKDEAGKLTPEGKADLSARIEDLGQRLVAGFYEHADEAISDLADLSNIATTYAKDFPSHAGTPWAVMQKALQKRLERIPGMEGVGDKSFEGFARKAAVRLGYSVEDWAKARFTQDPDFLKAMGKERAEGRLQGAERVSGGEGLMGLLGRTEATPLEGHPDLSILNHTEARTPALDAATESFGKEAAPALKALYDRLRGLTGAQGGTLGGFTSSTAHEGAFSEGKSYLNPSYHFSDALHTAKMYGLEGDAEAVKSIAATRAVATLEHEFLHDLGGHKTEQQFAEALTKLHDATSADPEYAALEKAFRESISDQTVEQFRETSPIFDQLVKEKYGDSSNVGSREGALQGTGESSPPPERGPQLRGSEGLPESGEGLGAEPGRASERGLAGDESGAARELSLSERHDAQDDGAPQRGSGPEAGSAGEEAEAHPPKAQGESPEAIRLIAARASGNPVEVAAAANDLLHKRLSDAAEAVEGDSKEVQRRKLLLKYAAKSIPKGEFAQKEFVKVMRNVGAPKEAAKGLWEAFKGSSEGGSTAEFSDLFGKVVRPGGWKNWRTWVTIWKAGMLGIPTQTGNTLGNAVFQQLRDVEGGVASFIDAIHSGVTGKERTRYASEIGAAWRGRARAWQEAWPDLKEAIAQAAKLEGMSLTDLEKHLGSYEEATKGLLNAPHDSKIFEFLTIPLKALGAADNFAKHMLKWEEFYREGHRQGTASGLRGKALHEFEAQQAGVMDRALQSTGEGMLFEKHAKSILRAAERMEKDTFQTPLGGEKAGWISKGAAALNRAKADLPPLELIAPFTKTPANIAIETLMRTPYGFRKVYKAWKAGEYKSDPGKLYDELAKPMLGTSIMVGVMGQVFGNAITGQGPADPKQQALKRETGWQPYSIKIGDAYVPYNRLEPLGSVLGMAADIGEAVRDGKHSTAQVKLKLAIASVGKNLTNKTFLAGLNNAFQATTDPVRFGPTLVKQLTGSIVPNIAGVVPVGSLAGAIDPIQRKTTVLTAPLAKIPGVSKLLPEQETALGTPRERTGGEGIGAGLQRLLFPSQITSVRHDVAARVAGELDRLDFPMQPPRPYIEISGRRIELSKEQQKRLAEAQFNAVNHMNRMIQDRTYQGLPDSPEDALPGQKTKEYLLKHLLNRYREPILNEIKVRAKARIFQGAQAQP